MSLPYENLTIADKPLARAVCAVDGIAALSVFPGEYEDEDEDTPAVVVTYTDGMIPLDEDDAEPEEGVAVVMAPSAARAFAAGLLNAADEAEGRTPLTFMPACAAPCCAPTPKVEGR